MQKPSYVLQSALVAVRHGGDERSRALVTLRARSKLTVESEPDQLGMVRVLCEGTPYLVFQQDLAQRAVMQLSASSKD